MINRATAYDLHWNTKEVLITLFYTTSEGEHVAEPTTFVLGKEAALQLCKSITGMVNLHVKGDQASNEPKPLKPDVLVKEAE